MRKWSHLPPIELLPAPFQHEFATFQIRSTRRQTLNFELSAEPHFQSSELPADVSRRRFDTSRHA
jgi:hypothetical protein